MVILKLRIRTADEWRELAPSDSVTDPVFVPTTDELEPQQSVIIEISSQLLPNKVLIRGTVQSWRPALPRMRVRAGATIDLSPDEQTKLTFLHEVFSGKRTDVPRRRHHRLPVSVAVRYRLTNSSSFVDSAISEIGVGGRMTVLDAEPFSAAVFTNFWWGSKLLDDSRRNGFTWDVGVAASLTALSLETNGGMCRDLLRVRYAEEGVAA